MGQEVSVPSRRSAGEPRESTKSSKASKASRSKRDPEVKRRLKSVQLANSLSRLEMAKMYRIFASEANGDGGLDSEEFQATLQRLEQYGLPLMKNMPMGVRLFEVLDTNKDGVLDLSEFVAGLTILYKGAEQDKMDLTFKVFDKNGNGFVTQAELQAMYVDSHKALLESMQQALTPTEFSENEEANEWQAGLIEDLSRDFEMRMRGVTRSIMMRMDTTGNGKLDKQEFYEFLRSRPYVKAQYKLLLTSVNDRSDSDGDEVVEGVPQHSSALLEKEVLLSLDVPVTMPPKNPLPRHATVETTSASSAESELSSHFEE